MWNAPGIIQNATIKPRSTTGKTTATSNVTSTAAATADVDNDEVGEEQEKVHDHFSKRCQYLDIVGPEGTAAFLRSVLLVSEAQFGFQYRVTEFRQPKTNIIAVKKTMQDTVRDVWKSLRHPDEAEPIEILHEEVSDNANVAETAASVSKESIKAFVYRNFMGPDATLQVSAVQLDHRVFTVGYVLTEAPTAGTLDMKKVAALSIPKGPLLGKLKNGETIQFTRPPSKPVENNDSTATEYMVTVTPQDVLGPTQRGRTFVLLGDTCDSTGVRILCEHDALLPVDWVSHECTFDDSTASLAVPRGHSTARMAGAFASTLGPARHLLLTHFSARFPSREKNAAAMDGLIAEAKAMCPQTNVLTAEDFLTVELDRKNRST